MPILLNSLPIFRDNTKDMPLLSVIIPTHNRVDILEQCLAHLEKQTIADNIEVIVVNDVQDDKFNALSAKTDWQIPIYFETISPCHQGVARNHGVQKAQSSTCLFIGDDIFLKSDVCAVHQNVHSNHSTPIAVLGKTDWDPNMTITPVMKWLMQSGWQFGYPQISKYAHGIIPKNMQHQFTYTSHISVPTDIALRTPFNPDSTMYGWEDIEWGMQLRENGVQVFFEPDAMAHHHHMITMKDSLKRMETIGESAVIMEQSTPGFDRVPHGIKRIGYEIFSRFPTMAGKHRAAFLRGIKRASIS